MKIVKIILILMTLFISGCTYPYWYFDKYNVVANFNADGSCSFSVDGKIMSNEVYSQEIQLISERCSGCTGEELDGYYLSCKYPDSFLKEFGVPPALYVSVVYKKGTKLQSGKYDVFEERGVATKIGANSTVLYPPTISRGGWANGITGAHLVAVEGNWIINEYLDEKKAVTGKLTAVAQRRARGF